MKQISLAFALLVLVTSFTIKQGPPAGSVSLYTTQWILKSIHGKDKVDYIYTRAFIKFDETKKRAGGNGSCNSFGSSLFILNDTIRISQLFSTKMYCEGVQEIEKSFFSQLGRANRFEINGKTLLLYLDKELLLEFAAE
ncbi:MAG: META domain-containing protein [Sphingobacteriales bacterium]|nr:META domain-containing protein [Sphingobacteriales bacterium]